MLAGAGHAQLDLLAALRRARPAGVDVTLVTSQPDFHYSGMLPAVIAGVVPPVAASIPVAAIARAAGLTVRVTPVVGLDAAARMLRLGDGTALQYDILSLDVGSRASADELPGVQGHAFAMRPFATALRLMAQLDAASGAVPRGTAVDAVVVGGGAAGVEIAFAVRARLALAGMTPRVTIVDGTADGGLPLHGFSPRMRLLARHALRARGIDVIQADVLEVSDTAVHVQLDGGVREVPSQATAWVTGPAPHRWLTASGFECDARGYPFADAQLALDAEGTVFGGGDCITLRHAATTAKAGVYAVRMAPVLAANVLAAVRGERPRAEFSPQRDFLALLSTSDGRALLRWRGVTLESRMAQWLKDRIDQRYLAGYRALAP